MFLKATISKVMLNYLEADIFLTLASAWPFYSTHTSVSESHMATCYWKYLVVIKRTPTGFINCGGRLDSKKTIIPSVAREQRKTDFTNCVNYHIWKYSTSWVMKLSVETNLVLSFQGAAAEFQTQFISTWQGCKSEAVLVVDTKQSKMPSWQSHHQSS